MDPKIKMLGPDGVKRIYENIYASVETFQNNTLKDIKDFKSTAQTDISAAVKNAISATTNAQAAADNAITAYNKANTATDNANAATAAAQEATTNANAATQSANDAASNANNKASLASTAADSVNEAAANANAATTAAQEATTNANTAAGKANAATTTANESAANANSAATAANAAAANANEKASLAQSAADNANNFVDSANTVYATKTELGDYSKTADIESTYVTQSNYNTKMAALDKTDSDNLASAKLYSDQGDALTLQNAKKDAASNYVTQSAYNTKMSALDEADTNNLATAKSYADTVSNNALNSAKVYVNDAVGRITSFEMSIVKSLPSTGTKGTIYLISASDGSGDDVYDEYIWVADTSKFEKIGTTRVDLSPYAKSADVANTYLAKTATAAAAAKLATARTIALTGSVTGSGTFDGSGNLSIATTTNHSHSYAGSSSAGGAANSAVKLATARSINGTSFDGTGNITTANWGTARNVYVADSDATNTGAAVSVNGGGDVTLKLPATIKAALSGNAATATKLATSRTIALSGSVTGSANFDGSGNVTISTTTNHTHNYAGSSSAGGVATSAAKLATARTINGTSFDGSGNITTAYSYNLSAGASGSSAKYFIFARTSSFNLTGNCGATFLVTDCGDYGSPITGAWVVQLSNRNSTPSVEVRTLIPAYRGTVKFGYYKDTDNGYFYFGLYSSAYAADCNVTVLGCRDVSVKNFYNSSTMPSGWTEVECKEYSLTSHTHNYAGSSSAGGVANSATILATARSINGTSFNGSADITTANWGTARNISISDSAGTNTGTAVSVNGSAAVTLKLPSTIAATLSGNAATASSAATCTGNSATATKLATARTINGTSFDGTGNITTANWGTARNVYIADSDGANKGSAVSVNGSGDITLKLPSSIYRNYFSAHNVYLCLGTLSIPQAGCYSLIKVYTGSGYNAGTSQDCNFDIHFRTSNDSSTNSDGNYYAGYVEYHYTEGMANNKVYVVQNSKTSYTIWIGPTNYSGLSFFTVENGYDGASWSRSLSTASSLPNGAIELPRKTIAYTESNVASATKLATARTIALSGSVTGSASFDGSGNITISTTTNHSHNYAGSSSAGGVANSAAKLATARNIALTGSVKGSGTFDGSGNLSIATTVNCGTTAPTSLANGQVYYVYEN